MPTDDAAYPISLVVMINVNVFTRAIRTTNITFTDLYLLDDFLALFGFDFYSFASQNYKAHLHLIVLVFTRLRTIIERAAAFRGTGILVMTSRIVRK